MSKSTRFFVACVIGGVVMYAAAVGVMYATAQKRNADFHAQLADLDRRVCNVYADFVRLGKMSADDPMFSDCPKVKP